jgi:hypothetical protein
MVFAYVFQKSLFGETFAIAIDGINQPIGI